MTAWRVTLLVSIRARVSARDACLRVVRRVAIGRLSASRGGWEGRPRPFVRLDMPAPTWPLAVNLSTLIQSHGASEGLVAGSTGTGRRRRPSSRKLLGHLINALCFGTRGACRVHVLSRPCAESQLGPHNPQRREEEIRRAAVCAVVPLAVLYLKPKLVGQIATRPK